MNTKKAVANLAREHYDRLSRSAVFLCGNRDAAEDLVQETFLAAVTALPSFQRRSSSYTWLYGIMLNKFRAWLREKNGMVLLPDVSEDSEASNPADLLEADELGAYEKLVRGETAQIVREALNELPAHHRAVLALRYLENMSYEEIAKVLDCSLGTVKSRIHYALRRIAAKLKRLQGLAP